MRDIATRAGVDQALLFRCHGSKDAPFATVPATQSRELLEESPAEPDDAVIDAAESCPVEAILVRSDDGTVPAPRP